MVGRPRLRLHVLAKTRRVRQKFPIFRIEVSHLSETFDPVSKVGGLRVEQELQILIIAEGVENAERRAFLQEAGCELMQGFRFVRPMPMEDIPAWFAAQQETGAAPRR
jgi:predicted signal transduction protein with EAL and GGDEF domain